MPSDEHPPKGDVTALLRRLQDGDKAVQDELIPIVYDELRRIAAWHMKKERDGHTLQTTALVNEAYLKLVNQKASDWKNRAHFFGIASNIMRRILVDHARGRLAGKRGGGIAPLPLDEALVFTEARCKQVVDLDEALQRLAVRDSRVSQIVELKFFGGLSVEEMAERLDVSSRTVKRDWQFGRAWLKAELDANPPEDARNRKEC